MGPGKTVGIIAVGLAVVSFLAGAGKVAVHYARNVRQATAASEISHAFSQARAWLGEQYADKGVYPRELPERLESGGETVDPDCRRHIGYEVSEQSDRYGLSWAYGPYFLKETWEKNRLVDSVWKDSARPDGP
ncbi:MAG: hypothetical protein IKQ55_02760 [Kiritimatiellae bacterium]|nr:hypothetical protein [Kiritimatiellia bacterium]